MFFEVTFTSDLRGGLPVREKVEAAGARTAEIAIRSKYRDGEQWSRGQFHTVIIHSVRAIATTRDEDEERLYGRAVAEYGRAFLGMLATELQQPQWRNLGGLLGWKMLKVNAMRRSAEQERPYSDVLREEIDKALSYNERSER